MQNSKFFAQYGTEKWAVEENLCFLLQSYWEKVRIHNNDSYYIPTQMPINPVSFVKDFMKEETLIDVKYAEQSKMDRLENNEISHTQSGKLSPPVDFIEGVFRDISDFREIGVTVDTEIPVSIKPEMSGGLHLVWPGEE